MNTKSLLCYCCLSIFLVSAAIAADLSSKRESDSGWRGVGIRTGFSATPQHQFFHTYETYVEYGLPWRLRSESGWTLTPLLGGGVGILKGSADSCIIGSIGPAFTVGNPWSDINLDLGLSVNLIGKRKFGYVDFGSTIQFSSFAGVGYRIFKGLEVNYRFSHMSNGHFFYPRNTPNPGLNLHLFGTSWQFR